MIEQRVYARFHSSLRCVWQFVHEIAYHNANKWWKETSKTYFKPFRLALLKVQNVGKICAENRIIPLNLVVVGLKKAWTYIRYKFCVCL